MYVVILRLDGPHPVAPRQRRQALAPNVSHPDEVDDALRYVLNVVAR